MSSSNPISAVLDRVDAGLDQSVERLFDILRIPSISTDPAYSADVQKGADWMRDTLSSLGFAAEVRPTNGHPMVVARYEGPPGAPHVLYYGHYDVQPPDPLDLWDSHPFEPVLVEAERGKRIVARGAVDDKGQVMTWIEAFRAWREETGGLPIGVTVLLEGEEETGSPSFDPFLEANVAELGADVCVVCDTGMWDIDTPAVSYMLRGMVYMEVTIKGPSRDLHSGMYGGGVVNPLNALARILGELHDDQGRVMVPSFYDGVMPVGANEKAQWDALGFDEAAFLAEVGMEARGGEAGFSALERLWARPTCDVNGMWGGYTGAGSKTVIPSDANAKVSFRLVPDQDPDVVAAGFESFIRDRLPPGFTASFQINGSGPAIRVPTDSPYLQGALKALREEYDRDAVLIGCGGSIPAVGSIKRLLGIDSLLVGFGLEDDRVHSPNEKFEFACYHRGIRSNALLIKHLAAAGKTGG